MGLSLGPETDYRLTDIQRGLFSTLREILGTCVNVRQTASFRIPSKFKGRSAIDISMVLCPPVGRPPVFNTEHQTVHYRTAFKIIHESGIPLGFKLRFIGFETQTRKGSDFHASAVRFKRDVC
jgi:hypothetical protein